MLVKRPLLVAKAIHHLRLYSSQAAVAVTEPQLEILDYLEGLPRPDPKYDETIVAIPRASSGSNNSVKERKAGRVPGIIFEQEDGQHGGNKRLISVSTNQIRKLVNHLGRSFFLSRLFRIEVRSHFDSSDDDILEKVRVLPRLVRHSLTCNFISFP